MAGLDLPPYTDGEKNGAKDTAQSSNDSTSGQSPLQTSEGVKVPASAQETLEQQAERSFALLGAIVESSDDAILSCDLNGAITSWNKGAERMFGYTADEILGHPTAELASPDSPEDTEMVLAKIRQGQAVDHYETLRRHKDGSDIVVSISVSPIRNSKGEVIGASKISRDITATRRAEQAIRNADKLALVGRMAASIAHEINNPLEAITNLLYLVEHESLSEEARSYLTLAQHELARVSHIASQTLGFFRGNSGSSSTQLAEIADSAIALHLGRLSTCNVVIRKEYTSLAPMFVHQGELRQVLVNLVGNALDAMPSGGRLRVRIHRSFDLSTLAPGVRIVVADTGNGMSSATMRQIFEPFYTTKGATGTGLGLWVSSQIVARHKGNIRVRSSQSPAHSGTVFSIFLPYLTAAPSGEVGDKNLPPGRRLSFSTVEREKEKQNDATSPEGESRRTPSEPESASTAYNAA